MLQHLLNQIMTLTSKLTLFKDFIMWLIEFKVA